MSFRKHSLGRSLVEVMVALVIAAVVLAAVLMTISGTGLTGRRQDAHAQLAEDGQLALSLIASQLRMAGYTAPRINQPAGIAMTNYVGPPVFGCDKGFSSVGVASISLLTCAPGPDGSSVVSLVYEADASSTVPSSANVPTDCLGSQITTGTASALGGNYSLAENRFYLHANPQTGNPALYCSGNGGTTPFGTRQPLVDNVEDLQISYGIAATTTDALGNPRYEGTVVDYVDASALTTAFGTDGWRRVSSVRVCLLMRTADSTADAPASYIGCDGELKSAPADRRIRKSVTSTISLRNRVAIPSAS